MHLKVSRAIFTVLFILILSSVSSGFELKTQYTTITYKKEDQLRRFNKEVYLGRLSYLMRNRRSITLAGEVSNKVDVIVEKVEAILEMFPKELRFNLVLLSSDDEVQNIYRDRYKRNVDYIAFYSPRDKAVYISVNDVNLGVLAHEFAHAIIHGYYGLCTSVEIHEILARYVEEHLQD